MGYLCRLYGDCVPGVGDRGWGRTLPQIADASTDLLANAPQLKVTINRYQAGRFGISPQVIDDTLNDAYGQRQIASISSSSYSIIEEITPELQRSLDSLDRIYIKSPLTGAAVPLSALVDFDTSKVGPLAVSHQGHRRDVARRNVG